MSVFLCVYVCTQITQTILPTNQSSNQLTPHSHHRTTNSRGRGDFGKVFTHRLDHPPSPHPQAQGDACPAEEKHPDRSGSGVKGGPVGGGAYDIDACQRSYGIAGWWVGETLFAYSRYDVSIVNHSIFHPFIHQSIHPLTHSFMHPLIHPLTHAITHTHSHTHLHTHTLTHSLIHSLIATLTP